MRRVLQWHIKLVNNVNLWWSKFKIILEQFYMGNVLLKSRKTEGTIHQYAGRQPVIGYRSRQLNSLFDILKPWWKRKWSIWLPTECLEEGETTKMNPAAPSSSLNLLKVWSRTHESGLWEAASVAFIGGNEDLASGLCPRDLKIGQDWCQMDKRRQLPSAESEQGSVKIVNGCYRTLGFENCKLEDEDSWIFGETDM